MRDSRNSKLRFVYGSLLASLVLGCAADPQSFTSVAPGSVTYNQGQQSLNSAEVDFQFGNFYSLTSPNPDNHCAGGATTYFDPLLYANASLKAPQPLSESSTTSGTTVQPAFINNVSVDVSDSNSAIASNAAISCSYGASSSAPPPSNCSTFDYGDAEGVYSNMSGSVLLIGGIQGLNYAAPGNTNVGANGFDVACGPLSTTLSNACATSIYALAVDTLPASAATDPPSSLAPGLTAATGPISTWANLSASVNYNAATDIGGVAGAAATFDPGLRKLLVYGGVSGATSTTTTASNSYLPTTNTWLYDFNLQSWTQLSFQAAVDTAQITQTDITAGVTTQLAKAVGGRALFGYAAVPGLALNSLSTNGVVTAADIDKTDRLVVTGGYDVSGVGADSHRLNPTFGPDFVDATTDSLAFQGTDPAMAQWIDPYYTQLMNNTSAVSLYTPAFDAGAATLAVGFGFIGLQNVATGSGNLIAVGGFNSALATNTVTATGGTFNVGHALNAAATGDFISISDTLPYNGSTALEPMNWSSITGGTAIPWYGGSNLVAGVVNANDVVYFGGSNLLNYLTSTTVPNVANPGLYFSALNPATAVATNTVPATTAMGGAVPTGAGMAVAHGVEGTHQLVVAWGGVRGATPTLDPTIYYMYNKAGVPTWTSTTPLGGSPTYYANAALVFSHVTGSFYLFGGYNPANGTTSADTWQLSFGPAGCGAAGTCTFTWKQLDVPGGLACTPTCPTGRRSHRMAEVNYFNRSPGTDPACNSVQAPCSFGIFMEGGTPDGTTYLGDRWMFDPTASGGNGAWLEALDMPVRSLSSVAAVDYSVSGINSTVHRAVMFGGETAMENPLAGIPGNSYVPPTLGDTWIFDFDNLTWNRADLLGEGYAGATAPTDISGLQLGSTYSIVGSSATQRELSPPAVSGATMVTRTRGPKGHLAIPEVFLIGGRTKDGAYLPFDHVYKFCMGTAAENAADATCVDYQHVSTLAVQASSKYTGAWIRKAPTVLNLPAGGTVSPNTVASYLGASTYDPVDDKIVLFGGITPNNGVASGFAVTDVANRSFQPYVFEYTPPANSADNGTWTEVGACTGTAPPTTSFYGHSMSYDTLNQQLVIIGGFDLLGAPNVTTLNQPAVYTAKRAVGAGGVPCYNWNPVTTFGNVQGVPALSPPTGGIGYAASLYVPAEGYNTGYYLTYDQSCVDAGPIAVTDPTVNKLYAGGAYFDINRAELGPNENLVLNLTYLPMGQTMTAQDGTPLLAGDEAVFYVHLIHTGESASAIQATIQPLYLTFAATDQYPQLVQELAVLGPKTGYMRSEQIVLPISANPSIDRIQIQRYSGTAVLISASIYRMGYR